LHEFSDFDVSAYDIFWRALPTLAPLSSGIGTFILIGAHVAERVERSDATIANIAGPAFLALALLGIIRDTPTFDRRLKSYKRRRDNIDSGVRFK
jgi:hypothetical protein